MTQQQMRQDTHYLQMQRVELHQQSIQVRLNCNTIHQVVNLQHLNLMRQTVFMFKQIRFLAVIRFLVRA